MSFEVRADELQPGMVIESGGVAEIEEVWRWPDGMVGLEARDLGIGLSACYRPGDLVRVTTQSLERKPSEEALRALRGDCIRARHAWRALLGSEP